MDLIKKRGRLENRIKRKEYRLQNLDSDSDFYFFSNSIELPPALAGGMKTGNYLMALAKRYIWLKPI
jgi:hypothetical protein